MVRYMKNLRIIAAVLAAVCCAVFCSACAQPEQKIEINAPTISSTFDEVPKFSQTAVEDSPNVNGKRFNLTLSDFTERYNQLKQKRGELDVMVLNKWKPNGAPSKDGNGVGIRYYYYDDNEVNITASVETESQKLVNVGVGTTVSKFMEQDGEIHNSERILKKAALVAQAACQSENNCADVLQNIFYRTTTESNDSIWFNGYVFSLSTEEDRNNSRNSVMLFRVFPVSESLRNEWKIVEFTVSQQ